MDINKIYNEDCLATMARMPDNFVDLTVTSPPYDNLRKYNGFSWDFKKVATELFRVTKLGGAVVWVVADQVIKGSESGESFKQSLFFKECGFKLHDTMLYLKNSYVPLNHNRYEQSWEYMFLFSKGAPKTFNPKMIPCITAGTKRNRGNEKQYEKNYSMKIGGITEVKATKIHPNRFTYDVGKNEKTKHNAPFPEKLAEDQILSWSNPNDLIYDPFMGSGTTAKMAKLNGRNYIGSEISEEYCKICEDRLLKTCNS